MADQAAIQNATEFFENAAKALRSATAHYQKASSNQPWTAVQAALEEVVVAQEQYDKAEGVLRRLLSDLESGRASRRFS